MNTNSYFNHFDFKPYCNWAGREVEIIRVREKAFKTRQIMEIKKQEQSMRWDWWEVMLISTGNEIGMSNIGISLRKVENIGISEKGKYRNIKNLPPSKHAYFDCTKNPHYFITEPSKEKKIQLLFKSLCISIKQKYTFSSKKRSHIFFKQADKLPWIKTNLQCVSMQA